MFQDLTWRLLLYGGTGRDLKFLLAVTQNVLPTPDNFRRWGSTIIDQHCPLCHRPSTLRHVLSACPKSLMQGRYTWHHDNVLDGITRALSSLVVKYNALSLSDVSSTSSHPFINVFSSKLICMRTCVLPMCVLS